MENWQKNSLRWFVYVDRQQRTGTRAQIDTLEYLRQDEMERGVADRLISTGPLQASCSRIALRSQQAALGIWAKKLARTAGRLARLWWVWNSGFPFYKTKKLPHPAPKGGSNHLLKETRSYNYRRLKFLKEFTGPREWFSYNGKTNLQDLGEFHPDPPDSYLKQGVHVLIWSHILKVNWVPRKLKCKAHLSKIRCY